MWGSDEPVEIGTRARDSFRQGVGKLHGEDGPLVLGSEATWLAKEKENIELSSRKLHSGLLRYGAPS